MSGFSEDNVKERLQKVNESQESIQTVSQWLMYHKKHAKQSVQIWAQLMHRVPLNKKLLFLYVANDVIQINRKKGGEFVREFSAVFPDAIAHLYRHADEPTRKSVNRVISIWEERKVYSPVFLNELKSRMGIDSNQPLEPRVNSNQDGKKDDEKSLEIVKSVTQNLEGLQAAGKRDAEIAEQVLQIPKALFSTTLSSIQTKESAEEELRSVTEASLLLSQLEGRLVAEIHDRTSVISGVKKLLLDQETNLKHTQWRLDECKRKGAQLTELKSGLKGLTESLPSNADARLYAEAPKAHDQENGNEEIDIPEDDIVNKDREYSPSTSANFSSYFNAHAFANSQQSNEIHPNPPYNNGAPLMNNSEDLRDNHLQMNNSDPNQQASFPPQAFSSNPTWASYNNQGNYGMGMQNMQPMNQSQSQAQAQPQNPYLNFAQSAPYQYYDHS